jgi:fluoride ion exporter CrcB/FEX
MRPIKDYSIPRLAIVGFGVGIIIAALRIAITEIFHISPSSGWSPFITGAVGGVVIAFVFGYFSKPGRDKQLLRRGGKI